MGAGPQPLTHPGRVPAALPWDAAAAAAASGFGPLAAWVAGSTGLMPPRVCVRIVVVGVGEPAAAWRDLPRGATLSSLPAAASSSPRAAAPSSPPAAAPSSAPAAAPSSPRVAPPGDVIRLSGGGALPEVGHVAAAVDHGRDLAASAAADGVTVMVLAGGESDAATRVADWLEGRRDPAIRGPLSALWRLGSRDLAVLCGVALGAGECGLALGSDGPSGIAAAGLACAVQPALRPRVRALAGTAPSPDLGFARLELAVAAP